MKNAKYIFFVLALIVLFFLAAPVWASGDCKGQSCNDSGGDTVVGVDTSVSTELSGGDTSVSTGGNRALALSNNMGDVDIADCLGSTQFGTPIFSKQKLVINNVCLADFYMKMQRYELAAMALCNVPGILKEFQSEEDCEQAHDFGPLENKEVALAVQLRQEEHLQVEQAYDERISALEQKLERRSTTRTVVQEKPWMTDETRSKLEAVLAE
jgi:hypothetical protein